MSKYVGDFLDDAIVPLGAFTTNAADGSRESFSASLEEADFTVYSDDGDGTYTAMTLDASTIIITENPGAKVGVYLLAVDMSNDSDFTTGKDYSIVLYPSDETIDGQATARELGQWSCENRSLSTAVLAQINAQVLDVMNVDTYAEPGQGAPGATISIFAKINYLYKAWRNQSDQDKNTGVQNLYNDGGGTVDQKLTATDDGTTTTRGEMGTGP